MNALQTEPVELEAEDLELCSFYVAHQGHVPESIKRMFNAPHIARTFVPLNHAIMGGQGEIDPVLKRVLGLYISLRLRCPYAAGHAIFGALRLGAETGGRRRRCE